MDIVDILVVGFFIISFLVSIFRKKKVKAESDGEVDIATEGSKQRVQDRKPKAKNPFEDFIKSINEELTEAKNEVSRSEVDEYYEEAMQKSQQTETVNYNTYQQTKIKPLIAETFPQKAERTKLIKSYTNSVKHSKLKRENEKAKDIKRRLLQKDSIKDFMILNEILGKPKALQK